jgi:esterase
MLETIHTGAASDAPPLLIAHGLFGSARNWGVIAKRLSETRQVLTVDMRNHGESPWADTHSYVDLAQDLAEVIGTTGREVDVLGHSMGGKAAMALALTHPSLIRRLIIADIAPVAYSHTQVHLIAAMRQVDLTKVETRRDADQQMQSIIPEDGVRAFLLQSLDVKGKRWRFNLDVLEREMPKIIGWDPIKTAFDGSTLFLSGGASDYVRREGRDAIRTLFPKARFAKIPGAGHWLHAEKPRKFEATVHAFLGAPGSSSEI